MFRFACWAPIAVCPLLLLAACSGGSSARLEIEIAPSPAAGAADGETSCSAATESLPRGVDCVTVTVCERNGTVCDEVPVLRPADDHSTAGTTHLSFSREGSDVTFDVRLEPGGEYDLELLAFDATGVPYARGRVEDLAAGTSDMRVRLEPFGRWSCAGPRDDGSLPAARALHESIALPNGDVLLLGGVTGESVSATAVATGAPLQRSMEIYDASESRFHVVPTTGGDPEGGYGAVFHRAFFVETTEEGRYRVRSIGGFTATGDDPAARFDAIQGLTQFSSPLLPAQETQQRDSVDILYDTRNRTAEIVSIAPGPVPRAGFDAVSEPDAAGLSVVVLGIESGGGTALRPVPTLSGRWYPLPVRITGDVASMPLLAPRFGATASRLSAAQVLVWGGNVDEISMADVDARAGELLGGTGGPVPASVAGLPPSSALHTATPIDGGILIAGGLGIAPIAGMSGGMSTAATTQPLTVISSDASFRVRGTMVSLTGATWPTPILHGATALPDETVVIAGGAFRMSGAAMPSHLWPTGSAIHIVRDATGVYSTRQLPSMIIPRWGHAIAPLSGGRVLVTGGFVREGTTLRAIAAGEILVVDAPRVTFTCEPPGVDGGMRRPDGGADAGRDAAVPMTDGDVPDAPVMTDAAPAADAG